MAFPTDRTLTVAWVAALGVSVMAKRVESPRAESDGDCCCPFSARFLLGPHVRRQKRTHGAASAR